ncbi:MAG TPA: hypothetical protein VFP79_00960 [Pseudolabrys sp.]|nr:hypothetical protein [Pseudolabrys sp.]
MAIRPVSRINLPFAGVTAVYARLLALADDLLGGAGGPARAPQPSGPTREMKDLSDLSRQLGAMDSFGEKVFGDRFEVGRDIEHDHLDNIQRVFDRFSGAR